MALYSCCRIIGVGQPLLFAFLRAESFLSRDVYIFGSDIHRFERICYGSNHGRREWLFVRP